MRRQPFLKRQRVKQRQTPDLQRRQPVAFLIRLRDDPRDAPRNPPVLPQRSHRLLQRIPHHIRSRRHLIRPLQLHRQQPQIIRQRRHRPR